MTVTTWLLLIVAIAIVAVLLTPWIAERLRIPMDVEEARVNAPGEFAELQSGVTHYRWFGPEEGPLIVCVHGLSTPSFGYEGLATGLAIKGWRVLTYDLYGRGYSDNTPDAQTADFFLKQLDELLEDQGITDKFSIVGYSMGGMIVTAFAARSPERIERIMLLSTGGVAPIDLDSGSLIKPNKYPRLAHWAGMVFGGQQLRKYILDEDGADPVRERQLMATRRRGYWPALLSCRSNIIGEDFATMHRKIAESNLPVLAIWAEQDQVIPISAVGILAQLNRGARQEVIKDANHGLTYSHPARIALFFDTWVKG